MSMSIQDFYVKFVSVHEKSPLLTALRQLSRLDDPRAGSGDDMNTWGAWDMTGGPPDAAPTFAVALA